MAKSPSRASKRENSRKDVVNVGIIGAGAIARYVHIPAYQALDNARVVAVAEPVREARAAVTEEFGIADGYENYADMLKRDDIDAVSVTTPNFLHSETAIAALKAGKHVLCEKPLAMNAREGAQMVRAARKSGKKLMCGYNHRFRPEIQTLKRFADDGEFGDVYYARIQALRRRGIPGWGSFGSKEKNGGGPLIDIGVHMLDTVLHILGFPKAVAVSGQTYQKFGRRGDVVGLSGQWDYRNFTVEDFAVAQIRFENKLVLTLESSFCANIAEQEIVNFELLGDQGGCRLNPLQMYREEHGTLLDVTPAFLPAGVRSHHLEIASFIESIMHDTPVFTPGEEALEVTRIIDAIYQSSETGREVRL